MKTKKPRVSARGAAWSTEGAARELLESPPRGAKQLGAIANALIVVGVEDSNVREELNAAHALGGDQAVVDFVKGRAP